MKTVKHILSYSCDKHCSYCINRFNEHTETQNKHLGPISTAYWKALRQGYKHIQLTGGEPVLHRQFSYCLALAHEMFNETTILTAHPSALYDKRIEDYATDVLFSFHKEYLNEWHETNVRIKVPVYASMVMETWTELKQKLGVYDEELMSYLAQKGFQGLTLREMYPNGEVITPDMFRQLKLKSNLSVRLYRKEHCVREDGLIILPDLTFSNQKEFTNE